MSRWIPTALLTEAGIDSGSASQLPDGLPPEATDTSRLYTVRLISRTCMHACIHVCIYPYIYIYIYITLDRRVCCNQTHNTAWSLHSAICRRGSLEQVSLTSPSRAIVSRSFSAFTEGQPETIGVGLRAPHTPSAAGSLCMKAR